MDFSLAWFKQRMARTSLEPPSHLRERRDSNQMKLGPGQTGSEAPTTRIGCRGPHLKRIAESCVQENGLGQIQLRLFIERSDGLVAHILKLRANEETPRAAHLVGNIGSEVKTRQPITAGTSCRPQRRLRARQRNHL